jgi:hypothetical protein
LLSLCPLIFSFSTRSVSYQWKKTSSRSKSFLGKQQSAFKCKRNVKPIRIRPHTPAGLQNVFVRPLLIYLTHVGQILQNTRDRSVGRAMGWTAGVRLPAGARFSLLHNVQNSSGAKPASYSMGNGERESFPRVKSAGREADHSSPSNAEVRSDGAIPPHLHMS